MEGNGMKKLFVWVMIVMLAAGMIAAQAQEIEIPELDIKRRPIPQNDAMEFMKKLRIGWNLGNTFDATRDGYQGDDVTIETYWCGVKTTKEMVFAIRDAGFRCIRMPVSWHNHVQGEDFTVNPAWMARVKEVVDYAMEAGLYVILNTHHDVDKKYYYPSSEYYESSEKYLTSVWRQMAECFKDYDEHLILESMNEPRLAGTNYEWNFRGSVPECVDAANCINRLNQRFVEVVRATGGYNAKRYLAVPCYGASPQNAVTEYFKLPEDTQENRIIVSVHAYTPYNFALEDGKVNVFPMSLAHKMEIPAFMNQLYDTFITNGIPVMLDEFGARDKNNLQDRVYFAAYYVATASARNIPCCWWDNNGFTGRGELFGLLNRREARIAFPEIAEAMMRYAGYDTLPEAQ